MYSHQYFNPLSGSDVEKYRRQLKEKETAHEAESSAMEDRIKELSDELGVAMKNGGEAEKVCYLFKIHYHLLLMSIRNIIMYLYLLYN